MEEQILEKILKVTGIPISEIEERIELSQSIIDNTDERHQYLKLLEDPDCDLSSFSDAYFKILELQDDQESLVSARVLVAWADRSVKEFLKAVLAKDFEQMKRVYDKAPLDDDIEAIFIHMMADFLKEETINNTKA